MSILVIIPSLYNFPVGVWNQVKTSSVKCDIIVVTGNRLVCDDIRAKVVYDSPDFSKTKSFRVSHAINRALETVDLEKYEWLVKIDDDVDFQPDFIERNIGMDYDIMGRGMALIIKMEKFIDIMSGRFFVCNADDTYIITKFDTWDCRVMKWSWVYPPYNYDKEALSNNEGYFLMGFDSGRMKNSCGLRFYRKPVIWFIGWFLGRYIYPYKLPVFHEKSIQKHI